MSDHLWHVSYPFDDVFSAVVDADAPWPGYYRFRIYPRRGDHCGEYVSQDRDDVLRVANAWRENPHDTNLGIYVAAY